VGLAERLCHRHLPGELLITPESDRHGDDAPQLCDSSVFCEYRRACCTPTGGQSAYRLQKRPRVGVPKGGRARLSARLPLELSMLPGTPAVNQISYQLLAFLSAISYQLSADRLHRLRTRQRAGPAAKDQRISRQRIKGSADTPKDQQTLQRISQRISRKDQQTLNNFLGFRVKPGNVRDLRGSGLLSVWFRVGVSGFEVGVSGFEVGFRVG